ncbi:hypothetical protein ACFX13_008129 [Malus domestica]
MTDCKGNTQMEQRPTPSQKAPRFAKRGWVRINHQAKAQYSAAMAAVALAYHPVPIVRLVRLGAEVLGSLVFIGFGLGFTIQFRLGFTVQFGLGLVFLFF